MRNPIRSLAAKNRYLLGALREINYALFRGRGHASDPFDWLKNRWARRIYWDFILRHKLPIAFEFEMNSMCNRACSYCPVSIQPRPHGYFDDSAYTEILNELSTVGFRGLVVPNFYGEPMLDKRIYEFVALTREKIPKSTIRIYTNADPLTVDNMLRLFDAGVSSIFISQHDDEPSTKVRKIQNYLSENPKYAAQVCIKYRTKDPDDQMIMSRGGLIDDPRVQTMSLTGCPRSRNVTITYEGDMILCCEDYHGDYFYGNVIREGFMTVWKRSLEHRRNIYLGEYQEPICKICAGLEDKPSLPANSIYRSKEFVKVA